jgi:hypothetical protein
VARNPPPKLVAIHVRIPPELYERLTRRLVAMRKKNMMAKLSDAVRAVLEDGLP